MTLEALAIERAAATRTAERVLHHHTSTVLQWRSARDPIRCSTEIRRGRRERLGANQIAGLDQLRHLWALDDRVEHIAEAATVATARHGVAVRPISGMSGYDVRGGPMTAKSFHTLIARLGERAGMAFPIHPHMLRHGCGYTRANAGHDTRAIQDWLGHRSIQHTVRYTELAPTRFNDFWR
jgi:hypothetical protein